MNTVTNLCDILSAVFFERLNNCQLIEFVCRIDLVNTVSITDPNFCIIIWT